MINGNFSVMKAEMEYISSIHVKFKFDIFIYILQGGIENTLMKLSDKLGNVVIRTEKQHKEEKRI